jgi:esterase/lipase
MFKHHLHKNTKSHKLEIMNHPRTSRWAQQQSVLRKANMHVSCIHVATIIMEKNHDEELIHKQESTATQRQNLVGPAA